MQNSKATVILVTLFTAFLVSCTSTKHIGTGTVIEQKKISGKDYKPKTGTLVGAGVGAGAGAVTGVYIGAATGATISALLAIGTLGAGSAIYIPASIIAGAAGGAVIGGVAGGATGAGIGYATDVYQQGQGVYQFTVRQDGHDKDILVTQYLKTPIPRNSRVVITLKDDHYYLEPVSR